MERIVTLHIEKLPEGFYLATSDSVQGLVAQGRTIAETIEIAKDIAKKLIEAHEEDIPNHSGDMPEGTLRAILKQADIEVEDFIKEKK
jgi:predicted RNase H-like HicB family nuclease